MQISAYLLRNSEIRVYKLKMNEKMNIIMMVIITILLK